MSTDKALDGLIQALSGDALKEIGVFCVQSFAHASLHHLGGLLVLRAPLGVKEKNVEASFRSHAWLL